MKKTLSRASAVDLVANATAVAKVPELARLHEEYLEAKRAASGDCGKCDHSFPEFGPVGQKVLLAIKAMPPEALKRLKGFLVCDSITFYDPAVSPQTKPAKITL